MARRPPRDGWEPAAAAVTTTPITEAEGRAMRSLLKLMRAADGFPEKQRQTWELILEGRSRQAVAQAMGISLQMVERHYWLVCERLGLPDGRKAAEEILRRVMKGEY